jgi:hypothetical protein
VLQNKKLNKYDHTAIDEQYETYVREGLDPFNASDPNKPLPSCERPLKSLKSVNP